MQLSGLNTKERGGGKRKTVDTWPTCPELWGGVAKDRNEVAGMEQSIYSGRPGEGQARGQGGEQWVGATPTSSLYSKALGPTTL